MIIQVKFTSKLNWAIGNFAYSKQFNSRVFRQTSTYAFKKITFFTIAFYRCGALEGPFIARSSAERIIVGGRGGCGDAYSLYDYSYIP